MARRLEVKSGDFTSGVREVVVNATHSASNTCLQQEDEAEENAAKTNTEVAANEEAQQERAEKVGLFWLRHVTYYLYYTTVVAWHRQDGLQNKSLHVTPCYIPGVRYRSSEKKKSRLYFFRYISWL